MKTRLRSASVVTASASVRFTPAPTMEESTRQNRSTSE